MTTASVRQPGRTLPRVEHRSSQVLLVYHEFRRIPFEQWYLLMSDEHWDNPKCRLDLLKKHHDLALERNAGILKFGDVFCAMQGKYDKRSSKNSLRPEHQHGDYLDRLVSTAADWYAPYAKNIMLIGDGNHETSIRDRHETDLNERLCGVLNDRYGARVLHGGYSGWVRFMHKYTSKCDSTTLWYTHGYGGGGPVTKDMIQRQRQQVYVRNADIMVSGHTHDSWMDRTATLSLSAHRHIIEKGVIKYAKLGTYKDAYDDGRGGFETERGHPPKPLGATWLRFHQDSQRGGMEFELIWAE